MYLKEELKFKAKLQNNRNFTANSILTNILPATRVFLKARVKNYALTLGAFNIFLYLVYQAYLADVNNMILYYKYPKLELSNFANLNCICEKFGHAFIKSFGGPNSL